MLTFLVFLVWETIFSIPLIFSLVGRMKGKQATRRRFAWDISLAVGGFVLFFVFQSVISLWVDTLWFKELGYINRFWTVITAKILFGCLGFVVSSFFFSINISVTGFGCPKQLKDELWLTYELAYAGSLTLSAVIGFLTSCAWESFMLYANQVPFGIKDPVFGRDVGFYVFTLPILKIGCWMMAALLIIAAGIIIMIYQAQKSSAGKLERAARQERERGWRQNRSRSTDGDESDSGSPPFPDKEAIRFRMISHLAGLGAIFALVCVLVILIFRWELLLSDHRIIFGANWTDVNVRTAVYVVYVCIFIVSAGMFLFSALTKSARQTTVAAAASACLIVLAWIIGSIAPALIQRYGVAPNELAKESEFIRHNIAFTRQAYGLTDDKLERMEFPVNTTPDRAMLEKNKETLESIRLWDFRVLKSNYDQNQAFRFYYTFPDVDVVRYHINGKLTQLMYAARELDVGRLTSQSQTWQNIRLTYTHGFGACASPVNASVSGGMPNYWIKDIPPASKFPELAIKQPRIYFGKLTREHVYVGTKQAEFDHPKSDQNAACFYAGKAGIPIGTGFRKLALAFEFDGLRLLMSSEITGKSRLLFRRDIETRVKTLAPFLRYDRDPYQVVADGELFYIWDAYTFTDGYPYSKPIQSDINYIRNSVKVTMNAYTGEVNLYVFEDEPIIQAYQKIFPGMFKPASEMPEALRRHVRYPEDLLGIQGKIFSVYHMTDPNVFYNREDTWAIAREQDTLSKSREVLPYYVVMRLPNEKESEFALILPFTPLTTDPKNPRNNMVGWLAGRCDGEKYGKLVLFTFPKDRFIYGPLMVGIELNQHKFISGQLTLWGQQGSQVVFGNLLVIPLSEHRLLYVQPIYMQAQVSKMPALKMVVVSSGEGEVEYGETFEEAIAKLAKIAPSQPAAKRTAAASPLSRDDRLKAATGHLERFTTLSGQGKHSEAGKELEELKSVLNQLLK